MKIQAFIFNWPGGKQHAARLEEMFRPHCETTVINSDDNLRSRRPSWHHIGNDAYFTAQWNAALSRFDGDIFVHIQADLWPSNLGRLLSECARYIANENVGVYAPNVDFNPHVYSKLSLPMLEPGVYEVPATDCSFWAISAAVLKRTPPVDPLVNRLGWGIEYLVSAAAHSAGLKVVRDYRFTAGHLKKRNYDNGQAARELAGLKSTLDPEVYRQVIALEQQRDELVTNYTWSNPVARVLTAVQRRAIRGALILQRRILPR